MASLISLLVLQKGRLLILKKKEVWHLPGGKLVTNEKFETCLRRCLRKQLGVEVSKPRFYKRFRDEFDGESGEKRDLLYYLGDINEAISFPDEVSDARLVNTFVGYDTSLVARKIIPYLNNDGMLK